VRRVLAIFGGDDDDRVTFCIYSVHAIVGRLVYRVLFVDVPRTSNAVYSYWAYSIMKPFSTAENVVFARYIVRGHHILYYVHTITVIQSNRGNA